MTFLLTGHLVAPELSAEVTKRGIKTTPKGYPAHPTIHLDKAGQRLGWAYMIQTNIMMISMIIRIINMSTIIIHQSPTTMFLLIFTMIIILIIFIITNAITIIMFIMILTWEGEERAECFEADKAVDCHLIGLIMMIL